MENISELVNKQTIELQQTIENLNNAKERLKESEAIHVNRFESFPFPVFIWKNTPADFELVLANQAFFDELNDGIDKVRGVKSKVFWENNPDLLKYLYACFDKKETFTREGEYFFSHGERAKFVMITFSFLPPDSVQIVVVNVTEQKKAEADLMEQKILFETIFNTITDGVVITNKDREILLANKGMETTFGYLPDELIGKKTAILYADDKKFKEAGNKIFHNDSKSTDKLYITYYKNKEQVIFPAETFGTKLFNKQGKWIGNLGVMRNITERINFIKEISIGKQKAEESDRLKSEFINNMSHEIRTPMNGILGFSNLLNKPKLNDQKIRQYAKIIHNSGIQLLRIIDDILEISKLRARQVKAVDGEVCLNEVFINLFTVFDIKAKENKTPLHLKKSLSDKESTIRTDEAKLIKILSNLLENALKFTNEGFIELGYKLVKNDVEIWVKDTGIGIPADMHDAIFERFSQAPKKQSQCQGGLGLGLAIAKENTKIIGGKIALKSENRKGATFIITIPNKPVHEKLIKHAMNNSKKNHFTILIAEDEEVNYFYLEILLKEVMKLNCTLFHAKNGKEAVTICQTHSDIDLVLMDIKMPIMDGWEATKQIKDFLPEIPIVGQSAFSSDEDKEKAFAIGFDNYFSKPISENNILDILEDYAMVK